MAVDLVLPGEAGDHLSLDDFYRLFAQKGLAQSKLDHLWDCSQCMEELEECYKDYLAMLAIDREAERRSKKPTSGVVDYRLKKTPKGIVPYWQRSPQWVPLQPAFGFRSTHPTAESQAWIQVVPYEQHFLFVQFQIVPQGQVELILRDRQRVLDQKAIFLYKDHQKYKTMVAGKKRNLAFMIEEKGEYRLFIESKEILVLVIE